MKQRPHDLADAARYGYHIGGALDRQSLPTVFANQRDRVKLTEAHVEHPRVPVVDGGRGPCLGPFRHHI